MINSSKSPNKNMQMFWHVFLYSCAAALKDISTTAMITSKVDAAVDGHTNNERVKRQWQKQPNTKNKLHACQQNKKKTKQN